MTWVWQLLRPAGIESPEVVAVAVRGVVERYEAFALELGWVSAAGEEAEQRLQEAVDAARAELVLLEPRANGVVGASASDRQEQLQHLLRLRAEQGGVVVPQCSAATESPAWRFGWRRSLGWVLLAAFAGCLLAALGHGQWDMFAGLGCLTVLLVFGPWQLARHLASAADGARRAVTWIADVVKAARLDHRIAKAERHVIACSLRQGLAERWVQERLDLIRHRIEMQRARAEKAAKMMATQHVTDTEENNRESFLHPTPLHRR